MWAQWWKAEARNTVVLKCAVMTSIVIAKYHKRLTCVMGINLLTVLEARHVRSKCSKFKSFWSLSPLFVDGCVLAVFSKGSLCVGECLRQSWYKYSSSGLIKYINMTPFHLTVYLIAISKWSSTLRYCVWEFGIHIRENTVHPVIIFSIIRFKDSFYVFHLFHG